jgi:hypothetical protein
MNDPMRNGHGFVFTTSAPVKSGKTNALVDIAQAYICDGDTVLFVTHDHGSENLAGRMGTHDYQNRRRFMVWFPQPLLSLRGFLHDLDEVYREGIRGLKFSVIILDAVQIKFAGEEISEEESEHWLQKFAVEHHCIIFRTITKAEL